MKEKRIWNFLLREWDISLLDVLFRTVWLLLAFWAATGLLRVCAWANEPTKPAVTTPAGVHGSL